MIPSWSHSKLTDFEKCKFLAYLKHDQKIPEPERPLPQGKSEHANDRGSRIHDAAELFVRGKGPMTSELMKFSPEFDKLRRLFMLGQVELEGEWGMSREWEIAKWRGAWLRLKLDALVFRNKYEAVAIDYKSGKKFGNEVKHAQQLQLYSLVTFLRHPKLEEIDTELWYLDVDDITCRHYTRDQALRFKPNYNMRGEALTSCEKWPPNPNKYTCQWCLYGPEHSGHCKVGVRKA